MRFLTRSLYLAPLIFVLASCASTGTLHTEGPLQLHLGVPGGLSDFSGLVREFRDERPSEQRLRTKLRDGEVYGDQDFTTPPPIALLQEIDRQLSIRHDGARLREKLKASTLVFRQSWVSFRVSTAETSKLPDYRPPGFAALDALMFAPFGGKAFFLCRIEVEINGQRYVGARGDMLTGYPPPMNYTPSPYFAQAVGSVLSSFADQN